MKQYTKDGIVRDANRIIIRKDGRMIINPTEGMILDDGWVEYVPPVVEPKPHVKAPFEIVKELVVKQWNERTDIGNEEALDYVTIVYDWSKFIGELIPSGKIVGYNGKLWRSRQQHTVFENYPPSVDTASLYEVIEKEHAGTLDDPIPYNPPMELFNGKYYVENSTTYLCTRDSGTALSHELSSLVGIYVEVVN